MKRLTFGRLSGRQFDFALYAPKTWRAMFWRSSWAFSWTLHRDVNHRCYCQCGTMFDGRLVLAGLGVTWWYSRFTGSTPCPCDEAFNAVFGAGSAGGAR